MPNALKSYATAPRYPNQRTNLIYIREGSYEEFRRNGSRLVLDLDSEAEARMLKRLAEGAVEEMIKRLNDQNRIDGLDLNEEGLAEYRLESFITLFMGLSPADETAQTHLELERMDDDLNELLPPEVSVIVQRPSRLVLEGDRLIHEGPIFSQRIEIGRNVFVLR